MAAFFSAVFFGAAVETVAFFGADFFGEAFFSPALAGTVLSSEVFFAFSALGALGFKSILRREATTETTSNET